MRVYNTKPEQFRLPNGHYYYLGTITKFVIGCYNYLCDILKIPTLHGVLLKEV